MKYSLLALLILSGLFYIIKHQLKLNYQQNSTTQAYYLETDKKVLRDKRCFIKAESFCPFILQSHTQALLTCLIHLQSFIHNNFIIDYQVIKIVLGINKTNSIRLFSL